MAAVRTCAAGAARLALVRDAEEAADAVRADLVAGDPVRTEPVAADLVTGAAAASDWLESQARVVEYWRDLLVASGEAGELIAALDAHAAFLNGIVGRA